jgi:hypothetical protein
MSDDNGLVQNVKQPATAPSALTAKLEAATPPPSGPEPPVQAPSRPGRYTPSRVPKAAAPAPPSTLLSRYGPCWRSPAAGVAGRLYCFLAKYIVLPETDLCAVVAWVLGAWLHDLWDRFPNLAITSPEKRSGKSRLLELLMQVCPRPWLVINPTFAVVHRKVKLEHPTMLLDEAQVMLRLHTENGAVMREYYCGGIGKDAKTSRCDKTDNHNPVDFPIYTPKVAALIGKLDEVMADRNIAIVLRRKRPQDTVQRCRLRDVEAEGKALACELGTWAQTAEVRARALDVYDQLDLPAITNDRMAELLLPLITVLTILGPAEGQPNRPLQVLLQHAKAADATEGEAERLSPGVHLLKACREIFNPGEVFIPTATLIDCLCNRREEPWFYWGKDGSPLNEYALAVLLKEFEIRPAQGRDRKCRGYYQKDFQDAWERYLPRDV